MPRNRDDPSAVRVYTICDESKLEKTGKKTLVTFHQSHSFFFVFTVVPDLIAINADFLLFFNLLKSSSQVFEVSRYLIARNVPALGCGEELSKLFGSYGEIVECKPMDAEDCESFTDVYWIEFSQVSNARFAKRKLDESVFLGNKLQVSYAPDFESLSDTQDKLERRGTEILSRIKFAVPRPDGSKPHITVRREHEKPRQEHLNLVSSNQDYFLSASMNETVRLVRSKLDKVQSSKPSISGTIKQAQHIASPALKKTRLDNRRRI